MSIFFYPFSDPVKYKGMETPIYFFIGKKAELEEMAQPWHLPIDSHQNEVPPPTLPFLSTHWPSLKASRVRANLLQTYWLFSFLPPLQDGGR